MEHSFNIEIAKECGIAAATILHNIYFWVEHNRHNEKHFHDGTYWTYNSMKAFGDQFPYLTTSQIRTALDKLRDGGFVITGNYNNDKFDRSLWYAVTEKTDSVYRAGERAQCKSQNETEKETSGSAQNNKTICEKKQMDSTEITNPLSLNNNIYINNTDNKQQIENTDINTDINTNTTKNTDNNKDYMMSKDIICVSDETRMESEAKPEGDIARKTSPNNGILTKNDVRRIVEAWNSLPSPIPKVRNIESPRMRSIKARVSACGGIDNFLSVIESIRGQPFLLGQRTDFVIKFDWFLSPKNFTKVMERNYADRDNSGIRSNERVQETRNSRAQRQYEQNLEVIRKWGEKYGC